jgi:hypothetical protein
VTPSRRKSSLAQLRTGLSFRPEASQSAPSVRNSVGFFEWLLLDDDTSKTKLLKSLLDGYFYNCYLADLKAKKQLHL